MICEEIKKGLSERKERSAFMRGVIAYAMDLIEGIEDYYDDDDLCNWHLMKKALLNGADDWKHYAWSGNGLCYNASIAERLCTPSELKKVRNGMRRPNSREEWPDVEARALYHACDIIRHLYIKVMQ